LVLDLPEAGSRINLASVQTTKETRMRFHIENMNCGGCARSVTKAIESVDPKARVNADTVTKKVTIETDASADSISKVLADAGFPASTA
jgi:copper chaperone